jgi:hypothetical protein
LPIHIGPCGLTVPSGSAALANPLPLRTLRRAGGERFRLVELHQQGIDRQALHPLVGALHHLLIPLPARMAEVVRSGIPLADLLKGMAGEVAGAVVGQSHAADAANPLVLGRQLVGHRPQFGHDHHRDRHLVLGEQGAILEHQAESGQHLREVLIQSGGWCASECLG